MKTGEANVTVLSAPEGVNKFFVLHENFKRIDEELQEKLQKVAKSEQIPKDIFLDRIYIAEDQNKWHRVRVTQILKEDCKVEVTFIDYGTTGVIFDSQLRIIPKMLGATNSHVLECSLALEVPKNLKDVTNNFFKFVVSKRHNLKMIVKEATDIQHFKVDLITTNLIQNYSIVDFIMYVIMSQDVTFSVPITIKAIKMLPMDDKPEIKVRYIVSPSEFYVSRVDLEEDETVMSIEMQEFYKRVSVGFALSVPGTVCAYEDNDEQWHRVAVLKATNSQEWCKVQFIDKGNVGYIKWYALYELDRQFYDFPRFSNQYSLAEVAPKSEWSREAVEFFKDCVMNTYDEVLMETCTEGVQLFVHHDGIKINVAQTMIRFKFGKSTGITATNLLPYEDSEMEAEISLTEKLHQVEIIEVDKGFDPSGFYIRLNQFKDAVLTFSQLLKKNTKYEKKETEWEVGDMCLVYCGQDLVAKSKKWMRGIIKQILTTKVLIKLCDFGLTPIYALSENLRVCPEQFEAFRPTIIPVHIACEKVGEWSDVDIATVNKMIKSYDRFFVTFKDDNSILYSVSEDSRAVTLYAQQDSGPRQNMTTKLERFGLVKSTFAEPDEVKADKTVSILDFIDEVVGDNGIDAERLNVSEDGQTAMIGNIQVSLHKRKIKNWLPAMPNNKKIFFGIPTNVDKMGNVVLYDDCNNSILDDMNYLINFYFRGIQSSQHDFKIGDPCLALFDSDALYYRGKVVATSDEHCTVEFIDYGNTKDFEKKRLFSRVMCAEVPAFAQRYRLGGSAFLPDGTINDELLNKLHFLVVDKTVEIRVKGEDSKRDGVKRCEIVVGGHVFQTYQDIDETLYLEGKEKV